MALFGSTKKDEDTTKQAATPEVQKREAAEVTPAAPVVPSATSKGHVVVKPRITEKAALQMEKGVYVFDVAPDATKNEIKKDIIAQFKVTPERINIVRHAPRKTKRIVRGKRVVGRVTGSKKAYVYLKEGDKIDIV